VDDFDQLGTQSSSRRFKKDIQPMDEASEAILALKPVRFQYKNDKTNTPQFGLVAEDVAEVTPDLVVCDKNGEIYTVRYDAVNAMLLNEFLKQHHKVKEQETSITALKSAVAAEVETISRQNNKIEGQEATIAGFKSTLANQQNRIETLTAQLQQQAGQIQKVSAQLEMGRHSGRTVAVNQ
jgi:uncharacterized coiled-coil protein SlyX